MLVVVRANFVSPMKRTSLETCSALLKYGSRYGRTFSMMDSKSGNGKVACQCSRAFKGHSAIGK